MTDRSMVSDAGAGAGIDRMTIASTTDQDQLQVAVEVGGDDVVVRLAGELDPHTAPLLQRQVDQLIETGTTTLVFDMSELRFIDSSGLRVVIAVQRRLLDLGGGLSLRSPSETARRLFEITGLVDHIAIVDDPAA